MQGRSVLKRLLLSLTTAVAIVLAFGPASALACDALGVDKPEAKAGETVKFALSACQLDDEWQLAVFFESPDSQDTTPEQRILANGLAEGATVDGDFTLPAEIGDADQYVTLTLFVIRDSVQRAPLELQMRYLATTAPPGGDTGPSGSTGSTPNDIPAPAAIGTGTTTLPKTITRTQQRKKNTARAKTKAKSKAKKSPAKTKKNTKRVTPVAPVAKAPPFATAPAAPGGGSFQPSSLPKPSAGPPPGLGGPPPANGTPPAGGTPILPQGGSPLVPAFSTGPNDSALNVPLWLIVVLGLLTLLGLGGAQTRMLGFWGPLPPVGRDRRDARLLALQRVAQSGAVSQKRIAELKKQGSRGPVARAPVAELKKPPRDRTPVG